MYYNTAKYDVRLCTGNKDSNDYIFSIANIMLQHQGFSNVCDQAGVDCIKDRVRRSQ